MNHLLVTSLFSLCLLSTTFAEPHPSAIPVLLTTQDPTTTAGLTTQDPTTTTTGLTTRIPTPTATAGAATNDTSPATVPSVPPQCKKFCDPPITQASECFSTSSTDLNTDVLKCLCTKNNFWNTAKACNDCLIRAGVPGQFTTQVDLQDRGDEICEMLKNNKNDTNEAAGNGGYEIGSVQNLVDSSKAMGGKVEIGMVWVVGVAAGLVAVMMV